MSAPFSEFYYDQLKYIKRFGDAQGQLWYRPVLISGAS